jgi:hypothetical protein
VPFFSFAHPNDRDRLIILILNLCRSASKSKRMWSPPPHFPLTRGHKRILRYSSKELSLIVVNLNCSNLVGDTLSYSVCKKVFSILICSLKVTLYTVQYVALLLDATKYHLVYGCRAFIIIIFFLCTILRTILVLGKFPILI